jgi:diacylglycerol kinase family enzyme
MVVMKKYALIANPHSRSSCGWDTVKESILEKLDPEVFLLTRPIDEIVTEIVGREFKTVLVVGGDGTISCVVDALLRISPELVVGVIPAGTLNHFSKDAHIPQDTERAIQCILDGHTTHVDVGLVNERHFINNSSVGIYPLLVLNREIYQKAGHTKWVALLRASAKLAYSYRSSTILFGTGKSSKKISSVFIGNNRYVLEGTGLGGRTALTEATLTVLMISPLSIFGLLLLSLRALRGAGITDRSVNIIGVQTCEISGKKRSLLVSYDGEITRMQSPLTYSIKPKALRLIVSNNPS